MNDNLIPFNQRTEEEQREIARRGGIASGEARRLKKTMKDTLKMCLEMTDKEGKSYQDLATIGLIKGAIAGNSANYKAIVEMLGELQPAENISAPSLKIEIVDNEKLEKIMYEE